jgi:hypothetical protein
VLPSIINSIYQHYYLIVLRSAWRRTRFSANSVLSIFIPTLLIANIIRNTYCLSNSRLLTHNSPHVASRAQSELGSRRVWFFATHTALVTHWHNLYLVFYLLFYFFLPKFRVTQGQIFQYVSIDFRSYRFLNGQLYVGLSRTGKS